MIFVGQHDSSYVRRVGISLMTVASRSHAAILLVAFLLLVSATRNVAGQELSQKSAVLYRAFAASAVAAEKREIYKWLPEDQITVQLRILARGLADSDRADASAQIEDQIATISNAIGRRVVFAAEDATKVPEDSVSNVFLYVDENAVAEALQQFPEEVLSVVGTGVITDTELPQQCLSYVRISPSLAVGKTKIAAGAVFASLDPDAAAALNCISERLPTIFGLGQLVPAVLRAEYGA